MPVETVAQFGEFASGVRTAPIGSERDLSDPVLQFGDARMQAFGEFIHDFQLAGLPRKARVDFRQLTVIGREAIRQAQQARQQSRQVTNDGDPISEPEDGFQCSTLRMRPQTAYFSLSMAKPEIMSIVIGSASVNRLFPVGMAVLFSLIGEGCAVRSLAGNSARVVDGIRLEVVSHASPQHPGKYLVALNHVTSINAKAGPYRAILMEIGSDGNINVLRRYQSAETLFWVIDLKPFPGDLYSFSLSRIRPPIWGYDVRFLRPGSGAEVMEPLSWPLRDVALDGHETAVTIGERRVFLFYRERSEAGKNYVDMEVQSLSSKDGSVVGRWSSRGLFPPEMTGDYLHFNSLSAMGGDKILASARSTSTLYVINLATGKTEDQIDSKSWKVIGDPLIGFSRQHYAHFLPNGNLLLYDNRDETEAGANSRAVEYAVDWKARTLTLAWEHRAGPAMPFRYGWGSAHAFDDGSVLIGWGDFPRGKEACTDRDGLYSVFSHVRRDKTPIFELRAPCGWASYRAYFVPET